MSPPSPANKSFRSTSLSCKTPSCLYLALILANNTKHNSSLLLSVPQPCQTIYQVFHDAVTRLIQYGVLYVAEVSLQIRTSLLVDKNKTLTDAWSWLCCAYVCYRRIRKNWAPAPQRNLGPKSSPSPYPGEVTRRTKIVTLEKSKEIAT